MGNGLDLGGFITGLSFDLLARHTFWIYRYFVEWLTVLNAALPPVGTVIILDYFMNRKDYDTSDVSAVRYENIISVMVGSFTLHFMFRHK